GTNLIVGGDFGRSGLVGGLVRTNLAKVATSGIGVVDPNWNPSPTGRVFAVTISDTNVFVGGEVFEIGGEIFFNLAELKQNGNRAPDPIWNPQITDPTNPCCGFTPLVSALVVDGTNLFIGGLFNSVGGQPRNGLAKLSIYGSGSVDPLWNPSPTN